MQQAVGWRPDEDDAEGKGRDVLMELKAVVHRDQGIVVAAHEVREVPVLDARPTTTDNGPDVVAGQIQSQV